MPGTPWKTRTGKLPKDQNNHIIQVAAKLQFEDGAVSPVISPKTGVPVTPQAFTVPQGATVMILRPSADARVGNNATLDGSATGKGYKKASGGADFVYPVAGVTAVYVRAEAGTVDVDFCFEMLG